jgi:hypothetical protein
LATQYQNTTIEFQQPGFLAYQNEFSPFLRIDMIHEGEHLRFRESEDAVKTEFMDLVKNIIGSVDKFLHPRFSKVVVD